nr:MBL fold metallo-hydrolase [Bacillus pinisoli]
MTWLNGGVTHLDGGAMFGVVPKALWSRKYPHNDKNQIELRSDPILVQMKGKNILIEAGIGNDRMSEKQKRNYGVLEEAAIEDSLATLGLTTQDIHIVLMTHMHFDHVCGLTKWSEGKLVPTFENAVIYVSETEWNEMREPNIRSRNTYWKENWESIQHQVQTFEKELHVLEGLKMIHTGGHSDGHAIITLESDGEQLFHLADLLPTHAHQNALWVMAYDDYPMQSIYSKEYWMNQGLTKQVWFSFYHDAFYRAIKWNKELEVIDQLERKK